MTANISPIIRDPGPEDAPAILEVLEAAYDQWPPIAVEATALDHLRWKMAPPGDIPLHHALVEIDGRPRATQLRWVCWMQIGEHDYVGETGADLAVHPAARGQGLSRLIKERDHERLAAGQVAGFGMISNAPEVRHMNDPEMVSREITNWVRPFGLRPYLAVHYRRGGLGKLVRSLARFRGNRAPPTASARRTGRIEVLQQFDERTDALWDSARRAFDVIAFRNAAYLNWRFAPRLSGPTKIFGWLDGERVLAYAVARATAGRGDLMDWLWEPGAEDVLPDLLDAVESHLRSVGAPHVTCWLPSGHRAEPALRAAGFAEVGTQEVLFGGRARPEAPIAALDICEDPARTLHMSMSDFDHV